MSGTLPWAFNIASSITTHWGPLSLRNLHGYFSRSNEDWVEFVKRDAILSSKGLEGESDERRSLEPEVSLSSHSLNQCTF